MTASVDALTRLAREESGRVLALLARRFGVDLADEAVQDALAEAARVWPVDGAPANPPAWLMTVAKRKAIDRVRREASARRRFAAAAQDLTRGTDDDDGREARMIDDDALPAHAMDDDHLRLVLLCCHPALDRDAQVALTLRLVGGLTTPEIAAAFLVPEATLAQRIVRAKRKIRDAGIPLSIPADLDHRVDALLAVLYLVFNEGYLSRSDRDEVVRVDLVDEAIRLTALATQLLPDHAEVDGLLALELFHRSRAATRTDALGDLVLLDQQDRTQWDLATIRQGNAVLRRALQRMQPGPYQLQAVIAAHHANARTAADTDWPAIAALYRQLDAMTGSPVVRLNLAIAVAMADGPQAGLALLDHVAGLDTYHLFHATRGELLSRAGDHDAARAAFERALELTDNPAEVRHLRRRATDEAVLVVLVGASGAGKSTWAGERFRASEVVSSDHLRGIVGSGPHDLGATDDAFAALDLIVAARTSRRLTTVVDTLGLDAARRRLALDQARRAGMTAIAVVFETDPAVCRARNRGRAIPVPAPALTSQLRRMRDVPAELAAEGWDRVVTVTTAPPEVPIAQADHATDPGAPPALAFVLQVSRFEWGDDPAGWLRSVAEAAASAGFGGIALMDHLIQIPQVGRAWDPIPEPWVTLGLLAGLPTSLRLGTLVSPASAHLAGRLAKQAATLDVLTGGRAFCGVGAGWWEREHAAFGIPFAPGAQRVADLERCIETMRALWAPGTKAYEGERVSLPETTCYPRPAGALPIIVGGRGPRVLDVAARLGDACNVPPAFVEQAVTAMAGKPVTVLDVPVLGTDREHAASIVERVRGRTSAAAFARTRGAGTAADLIARYRRMAEQGVSTVFVTPADFAGPDEVERWHPVVGAFTSS